MKSPSIWSSLGAVADAIGHCVVIFAFVPALAAVPRWLLFEATNPLNVREPLILAFLLMRGGKVVLDAFYDGIVPGVLSGVIEAALVSGWLLSGARVSAQQKPYVFGATTGALAACVMIALVTALHAFAGGERVWGVGAVAFEIVSGAVCGIIAAPTAVRLLLGAERRQRATSLSASQ